MHNTGLHRLGPEVPEGLAFWVGSHLVSDSLLTCATELMPSPDAKLRGENVMGEKILFSLSFLHSENKIRNFFLYKH